MNDLTITNKRAIDLADILSDDLPKAPYHARIVLPGKRAFEVRQTAGKDAATGKSIYVYLCEKCKEDIRCRVEPDVREQLIILDDTQTSILLAHKCKTAETPKEPITLDGSIS